MYFHQDLLSDSYTCQCYTPYYYYLLVHNPISYSVTFSG